RPQHPPAINQSVIRVGHAHAVYNAHAALIHNKQQPPAQATGFNYSLPSTVRATCWSPFVSHFVIFTPLVIPE
ncbi:MAG TPA: hypothetical protein PKB02_10770, partial [Anaerohalosphaeraceae bacterium]|nr:hypothetical protein [Anaerohalosphaeraceae bacterium]